MPEEAERQEREEDGLQPTQVPVPHKQVRFNVFFSLRLRTLRLSTGMEGRATEWQLLPSSPAWARG